MLQQNTTKRIGYWFLHLHEKFEVGTAEALQGERLSRRQWQVLHALAIGVDTVDDLDIAFAPFLAFDRVSSYSLLVAELTQRGWVKEEGRSIRLSESGLAAHARAEILVEEHATHSLAGITESQFIAANEVLSRIAHNLDSEESQRE
ncbi:hypothetical protein [Rhodococcus sp. IEGM 1330]|uniref:hypothetical protein n=1 Tax=Rhodococcus sp. IEGM 1330 TaxID=3082225 RepID=UPI002954B0CC|nr:hypothetical protein [Rhodococcus sp. IEGM 1330]MDV8025332.1 hypothetical protein [Rhodococcus sp. IEGM 1330]